MGPLRHVYVLTTLDGTRYYVGLTNDVAARLTAHNTGNVPHTAKFRPWRLHLVISFHDEDSAHRFERYLKTGSGRSFARRHFDRLGPATGGRSARESCSA